MSEPQISLSPAEQQLIVEYRRRQELAAVAPHSRERVMMCVGGMSFGPQGDDLNNIALPVPDASQDGVPSMDVPLTVIEDPQTYAAVFANRLVDRPRGLRVNAAVYVGTIDEIVTLLREQLEAAAASVCTLDKHYPMRDAAAARQNFVQLAGYEPGRAKCLSIRPDLPWIKYRTERQLMGAELLLNEARKAEEASDREPERNET